MDAKTPAPVYISGPSLRKVRLKVIEQTKEPEASLSQALNMKIVV